MYFDHVRCPVCNAQFDPEAVVVKGGAMSCPSCGSQLSLKSLFGVSEQFEDLEHEHMTIDDLVPGGPGSRGSTMQSSPAPQDRGWEPPARRAPAQIEDRGGREGDGSAVLRALREGKKRG